MRVFVVVAVVVLSTAGCASLYAPADHTAPAGADAFDCHLRTLNQLGYTIVTAERDGGLINAERRKQGGLMRAAAGAVDIDRVTVSIFADANAMTMSRIIGNTFVSQEGGVRDEEETSPEVKADVKSLVAACSKMEIAR